jgi:MoxR-like ATPase
MSEPTSNWRIYRGVREPHDDIHKLPPPPPWRDFDKLAATRGETFQATDHEVQLVNAALYLRRPLLVTGPPGAGKSSLAYAVARELKLGEVLRWSINSRSTLGEGLYQYDALARLRDANLEQFERGRIDMATSRPAEEDIGRYLKLGPLGTALLTYPSPRVLLIDEIDKSDIDFPNDLLHVFEEGCYEIPELVRLADKVPQVAVLPDGGKGAEDKVSIYGGRVRCQAFPFVVLTSNGERELPPAFLRRCLRLDIPAPNDQELQRIITAHLKQVDLEQVRDVFKLFTDKRDAGKCLMATDQLLNAVFLVTVGKLPDEAERKQVLSVILRELGRT